MRREGAKHNHKDIERERERGTNRQTDRQTHGGAAVKASDFRSWDRGFDSRTGRNQVT